MLAAAELRVGHRPGFAAVDCIEGGLHTVDLENLRLRFTLADYIRPSLLVPEYTGTCSGGGRSSTAAAAFSPIHDRQGQSVAK